MKKAKMRELETGQETIEVEVGNMEKAHCPNILEIRGLNPCIGIGVYDCETKSGYMLHKTESSEEELNQEFDIIEEDYGSLSELRVVATGCFPYSSLRHKISEEEKELSLSRKELVEKVLKERFKKVRLEWFPKGYVPDLYLYTLEGKFVLEAEGIDELLYGNPDDHDENSFLRKVLYARRL